MHFLNTLTNSFVVGEKDDNGNIISMQGYPKGGLTYLIVNDNVKFYLREDYMYLNVLFSADVPLLINGIPVGINALPTALKEIFKQEKDEIGADIDFNPESFNAIANAPVTNRFNADEASINALSGDVETLGEQLSTKADISAVTSIAEAKVEEYTYDKATIDDKIANVDVSGQLVNYLTISGAQETYQPLSAMTGYATEQWVLDQHYITGVDLSDYAKIEDIPTSNSGLTNDAGYITESALDGYATEQWVGEQGYLTEHQDISGKQDVSGMTAYTTTAVTSALNDVVTGHTADTTIHVTLAEKDAWNAKADLSDIPDVSDYFDGAEYVSSAKTIYFTHEGVVKATIDCTDFVIDGMIDDVSIQTLSGETYLVIDFNTASGKEDILIPISDIFDASNYYTKAEVDAIASGKVDTNTFNVLSGKVDTNNEVAARAINDLYVQVSGKAETSDVTAIANDVSALSGKVDVNEEVASRAINDLYIKVDDKAESSAVTVVADNLATLSGKVDVNEEVTSRAINDLYLKVDGKAESSAITEVSENLTTLSGKVDTNEEVAARAIADLQVRKLDASAYTPVDLSNYYTSAQTNAAIDAAVSGKADASRVDEIDEVTARALNELSEADEVAARALVWLNDSLSGAGKTYTAGRGIDITNDVISFNLPIYSGANDNAIQEGQNTSAKGNSSHAEGSSTTASGHSSHAEGQSTTALTDFSHAEGYHTKARGTYGSHAEGNATTASGSAAHAEGRNTKASGNYSHAEGDNTTASGESSHAEGYNTKANGNYSHAEGIDTIASGGGAHAEGYNSSARGESSHAEGQNTIAIGKDSHAEGNETIANNNFEHASGYYNVSNTGSTDADKTLFSVGNGIYGAPHNAFEIRRNGDIYISSGGTDIKLQDAIGSGGISSGDVQTMIDSSVSAKADTSAVTEVSSGLTTLTARVNEIDEVSAMAIDELFEIKLDASAYTPTDLSEYWTSGQTDTAINAAVSGKMDVSGMTAYTTTSSFNSHSGDTTIHVTAADKNNWNAKSNFSGSYNDLTDKPTIPTVPTNVSAFNNDAGYATSGYVNSEVSGKTDTSTFNSHSGDTTIHHTATSAVTSGSTDVITSGGVYQQLGGLKLLQITQNDYDNLQVKDNNTLYVIIN